MKLTKTLCQKLKPKEKPYKKFDGGGLYLEIMPNGNKLWRLKYYYHGKEKRFSLGKYPTVTLVNAREKRLLARKMLDQGIDPSQNRIDQEQLAKRAQYNTFEIVAREWYDTRKNRWSQSHAGNILRRLEKDVFPFIGRRPIAQIKPPDILDVLRKIENRNALELARRARQYCGQVFQYGIQTGRCEHNPTMHLQGALKSRKKRHFAALDIKEVPQLIRDIERNEARLYPRTRRAIWLSMLSFARPGEIRKARWEHISLEDGEWIIPGELMKSGRDHIIPLSTQSIRVLLEQQEETGRVETPWVFPGQANPKKPMSDGTVSKALIKLGYRDRMTAHGFRALARTTIREKLKYYPDIIEAQLAHKPPGPLGAAYDRAQFLDDRKIMMQEWADYLDDLMSNRTGCI